MHRYLSTILLGSLAGLFGGIGGSTGSVYLLSGLILLGIVKTHTEAAGTILAIYSVPVTFAAGFHYYKQGVVQFDIAAILLVTLSIFTYIGARFHFSLDTALYYFITGITILIIALYHIYNGFKHLKKDYT